MKKKSRKVKAAAKGKAFISKKKLKGQIPIDVSDSGSDVDSDSFFHDEIDDYHKEKDDQLSTDDELIQHKNESSEEEEVLPITDDEEESEDNEKDFESDNAEEDLPNTEAWGKKKSVYYNADFVDEDKGRTYREEDAEAAKAEADEAYAIQKSVFSNITANNLGANLFLEGSEASEDEEEKEEQLTSATKKEKIKFLKKSSPEMFEYIRDYKTAMIEIQEQLLPLLPLACEGKLPTEACENYIKVKYHLLLHLSLNISFYMLLKSSGTKLYHHPVMQRINSLKKFLDQLKPIDEAVREDVKVIVEKLKRKEEIALNVSEEEDESMEEETISESLTRPTEVINAKEKIKTKKSKKKNIDTETEKEIMFLINEVKEGMKKKNVPKNDDESKEQNHDESMGDEDGDEYDEKRTITYQIAKNKGLGVRRKKEYRNPRVKHRIKFRKAEIRRKGQVRKVVKELTRYEGEHTGISTHVVKSRKLK